VAAPAGGVEEVAGVGEEAVVGAVLLGTTNEKNYTYLVVIGL
jgi:hypothetical protein